MPRSAAAAPSSCRVCGGPLSTEPLFVLTGMPAAAQGLPREEDLRDEGGVDLDVRQCSGCGLVQLANEPVTYHREVIRASAVSDEMRAYRAEQFAAFVRANALQGRPVLEVGCGRGEYLAILAGTGADAHGIEYGEEAVADCLDSGLDVARGFLGRGSETLPGAPFDGFIMLNYLEHLPEPGATLAAVRDNLADGAAGIVEVPNFDMILARSLFSELVADHLTYFTTATLTTALTMHGFDVIGCRPSWHDYIISAVVRKRPTLDLVGFTEARSRVADTVDAFVDGVRASGGRVAVWGAGHQALTALAAFELKDRIAYVVDSATFKQGRFTPATHVPIVAPDALASDPVDAVLVMAAAYSDEVVRTVRERFGDRMRVAVLREDGVREE